jgi:molybdopterin synthase catalytic subunit
MNRVYAKITADPIEPPCLQSILDDPSHGGRIWFYGTVRNFNHKKPVRALSYDAFQPLAESTFVQICAEAKERWGDSLQAVIVHRIGKLEVGETAVAIGVGMPHRDEAYQASRYIIEQLKIRAPLWKKEHYEEGESDWLQGHALCSHG